MYSVDPVAAMPASAAAMTAAVAESAPTTRCRDEPRNANTMHREHQGVQTGDHRHAGDGGVAHDFGDGQCGERDAGDRPRPGSASSRLAGCLPSVEDGAIHRSSRHLSEPRHRRPLPIHWVKP